MRFKESLLIVGVYNILKGYTSKITGVWNTLRTSNAIMRQSDIKILGNRNSVSIGRNSRLYNSSILVFGDNDKVKIGDNCILRNTILHFEDNFCRILIGNQTTIEGAHIAVTEPNSTIKIGEDCMFSSGMDIMNGDSHSIIDLDTEKRINFAKDIYIYIYISTIMYG